MSAQGGTQKKRTVIPRWRSYLNTPSAEVRTLNRFPDHSPITAFQFHDLLKIWRKNAGIEDAVDIMDAGIASGARHIALEGAKRIVEQPDGLQDAVIVRASTIVSGRSTRTKVSSTPFDEQDPVAVARKIASLKKSAIESPRNALVQVELARLYSRLGQIEKAAFHINTALSLSPNDRYVVRSATRFFTMIAEPNLALKATWNAEAINIDPWIQSAELASADLSGVSSRFAKKSARKLSARNPIDMAHSELWFGWISNSLKNDLNPRNARKLIVGGLSNPTENALAQGLWLSEKAGLNLAEAIPKNKFSSDAHEAKTLAALEMEDYVKADIESQKWFLDQPFQVRSCINASYINMAYLERYDVAAEFAKAGLLLHPYDELLLNLATICSAYSGQETEARKYLTMFIKRGSSEEAQIFIAAARGLIEFEFGDQLKGVNYYRQSIELARKQQRPDLIVLAVIYFSETYSRHFGLLNESFEEISNKLEKALPKLGKRQNDFREIWKARKPIIERRVQPELALEIDRSKKQLSVIVENLNDLEAA